MKLYILEGHDVVQLTDTPANILTWARWFETADRHVAVTDIGECRVSTAFLGIDHGVLERGPILFETMAFDEGGHAMEGYTRRYATWSEAASGHLKVCQILQDQP